MDPGSPAAPELKSAIRSASASGAPGMGIRSRGMLRSGKLRTSEHPFNAYRTVIVVIVSFETPKLICVENPPNPVVSPAPVQVPSYGEDERLPPAPGAVGDPLPQLSANTSAGIMQSGPAATPGIPRVLRSMAHHTRREFGRCSWRRHRATVATLGVWAEGKAAVARVETRQPASSYIPPCSPSESGTGLDRAPETRSRDVTS